jgi:hypothetical protein
MKGRDHANAKTASESFTSGIATTFTHMLPECFRPIDGTAILPMTYANKCGSQSVSGPINMAVIASFFTGFWRLHAIVA